jgi:lysyl-tRNA synthetase class 2
MSDTTTAPAAPQQDENQLIAERREKLKALRQAQAEGKGVAFPNDFKPEHHAQQLHDVHGAADPEALNGEGVTKVQVKVAGP